MLSIFIFCGLFRGTEPAYAADNQVINIVLDPGHGGTDYGATSVGGLEFQEKNITFKLAQYIQLELREIQRRICEYDQICRLPYDQR